jgi:hypothetical protein
MLDRSKVSCKKCKWNNHCPGFDFCPVLHVFYCKRCGNTFILNSSYNYRTVSPEEATALRLKGHQFTEITAAMEDCTGEHPEGDALRWHCPK